MKHDDGPLAESAPEEAPAETMSDMIRRMESEGASNAQVTDAIKLWFARMARDRRRVSKAPTIDTTISEETQAYLSDLQAQVNRHGAVVELLKSIGVDAPEVIAGKYGPDVCEGWFFVTIHKLRMGTELRNPPGFIHSMLLKQSQPTVVSPEQATDDVAWWKSEGQASWHQKHVDAKRETDLATRLERRYNAGKRPI